MTNAHRIRLTRMLTALMVGIALTLLALPAVALATPDEIRGCDHILVDQEAQEDGSIDILTVSGNDGETVYLEIRQADGTVIASHLGYTLHDDDGDADEDGKIIGVVSIETTAGVSLDGAIIRVYEDRAQSRLAWEGTVETAYAMLDRQGQATRIPLVIRTLGDGEERPFSAPGTLRHGAVYALASDTPTVDDGHVTYDYEISDNTPASVDGHVSYYDADDPSEPIKVDTIAGIRCDTSRAVTIPDIISANGHHYRTMMLASQVTLSHPGITEIPVQCMRLESDSWDDQGGLYTARINYVDAAGKTIGVTDSVIVDRLYLYTPPTRLHVRGDDGQFVTYVLSDGNDLSDGGAIVLEPGQAEGTLGIDVTYEPLADDAERIWTVVLVNGSVSPSDPAREIRRVTYRGRPGELVTHRTDQSIDADGTTLVPVSFAESTYRHTFDVAESQMEQTIYYVPDGWTDPDPYEVTVNYVNIATNSIISSETYTATPTMRQDLEIATPATFDKGGTQYVRLNGQELAIRHSFYSPNRTYSVYYRLSDDDLHMMTVIRSVRVEYIDGETGNTVRRPTTVITQEDTTGGDAGAFAGAGTGATGGTAGRSTGVSQTTNGTTTTNTVANAGTVTGIGTDTHIMSITDDDKPLSLVTSEGSDLATIRIEDNETPTTSSLGSRANSYRNGPMLVIIAIGIVAIVIATIFVLLSLARQHGHEDGTERNGNGRHSNEGRRA